MREFFEKILPEGILCIATKDKTDKVKHHSYKDYKDVEAKLATINLAGDKPDVYFCVASLSELSILVDKVDAGVTVKKRTIRSRRNISQLKSLFVDLDVSTDPNKKGAYTSQREAIKSLRNFCTDNEFPLPVLVSSGGGVHAYWPFRDALDVAEWLPVAKAFKDILVRKEFKFDPAVTSDCTRLLRVPGTFNSKNGNEVKILEDAIPIDNDALLDHVERLSKSLGIVTDIPSVSTLDIPGQRPERFCKTPDVELKYPDSDFKKILGQCEAIRLAKESGCEGEPVWKDVLGVCARTTTPEASTIEVSEKHRNYNKDAALAKLAQRYQSTGATLCGSLAVHFPNACKRCAHQGRITSPIVLGFANAIQIVPPKDVAPEEASVKQKPVDRHAPEFEPLPPFHRKEGGGIMHKVKIDNTEKLLTLYEYDLYPVKRTYDETSEVTSSEWYAALPHKEHKIIRLKNSLIHEPKELFKTLADKGVMIKTRNKNSMIEYFDMYIQQLQSQKPPEISLSRQGWRHGNNSFVLADTIYHTDGYVETHSMARSVENDIRGLGVKGSLRRWADAIQFFNVADHEAHRFCLYAAFGSLFFHTTGHKGALIYLSGKSGCGKSTVQKAINSIWGHPSEMLINGTNSGMTINAFYGIMSAYNNIPVCLDEVSNLRPDIFMDMALAISQGTGKRRSGQDGRLSQLIENWANVSFASSNSDAYLTMAREKDDYSAAAMRVFQIYMKVSKVHSKLEADKFANIDLPDNYGKAGRAFLGKAVPKYDAIRSAILKEIDRLGSAYNVTSAERFWIAIIACAKVVGSVCRDIELLKDFPVERDIDWAMSQIARLREQISDTAVSPKEVVVAYLNTHLDQMIILNVSKGDTDYTPRPSVAPRVSLNIRYEKDARVIYINKNQFKMYCEEKGHNFASVEYALKQSHVIDTSFGGFKNLGSGTDYATGNTRCYKMSADKLEYDTD